MNVVLNELDWAQDMIASRSLGPKPFETLTRVAKYYIHIHEGSKKNDIRAMLDKFLLQCDPTASIPKWSNTLDRAVTTAMKYNAIQIDHIEITETEMRTIDIIPAKQTRRLAFALLCLAKYWDAVNPKGNHWVNTKDSDIMRMANINTSIKRQGIMYHYLREAELIQFSKKVDNTNVRVCFIDTESTHSSKDKNVALQINDFRNLGYQYLKYHGEPYFECENCGIVTKYNNPDNPRGQKYCKECAVKVGIKQRVNSVMRKRELKNQEAEIAP